jgi:endonuclease/exonuclease/phosphatase family metal-dependent hydrolase
MANVIRRIMRFSSFVKIITIVVLCALLISYLAPFVHPNTFKLLPLFGLLYPVFLLIALFLLIIWALARSRWAIITLVIIVIGGKLHFRLFAFGENQEVNDKNLNALHVMSYNVRLFDLYTAQKGEKYTKRDAIFKYIQNTNPDIVCFQEFYHQDKPTSFSTKDTLIELLNIKDYHERYAHKLTGRQNFGVAVLSKYPMIAKGDVMFPTQGEKDFNYCVFVDIIKNNDTFRVYNVHLQSIKLKDDDYSVFDKNASTVSKAKSTISLMIEKLTIAYPKRAEQARAVVEHIKTSPYPTIVCGDFNDTPMSYAYNQFNNILTDSFRNCMTGIGSTYVGRVPAGRIDYIFYSKELTSSQFKIQEIPLSDHRAISCKIYKSKTP